ncbi:ATP-binding protein [Gracilibacillus thailandensis]|uniref:AAA family ATPase n=1 Tax=Gracilibacillus thailandensis TaxID=563735 RepID=A0A6N7R1I7_9BACI|nr:AAA family ATPase [Gracilibacillus thailandensis]MRI67121.1 AAA family ATPase [Gracilibacillus thailandensis]
MRIESIHIYGFGKWIDQHFSLEQDGPIEIAGDNESGKSTLRQFILYILFGLKSKQIERFTPKQGSTVGGRLTVSGLANQTVTIERVQGKHKNQAIIYGESGTQMDEEWLKSALQGIDRKEFQSIYTFDAHDLKQIQDLDNQSLHEVLLAVGMTGSDRIYYAEKNLEKTLADLFKPYGKKPEINQLFQELADLKKKLTEAKEKESQYQQQLTEIEELDEQLIQLQQAKSNTIQRQEQAEKRLTHYALIEDYYFTTAQLKRQDATITFPVEGLKRLNEWKDSLLPLKSEEQVLRNNLNEVEQQISQLALMPDQKFKTVERGLKIQYEMNQIEADIQQIGKRIKEIENEMISKLENMQINLTIEQLRETELPFYLEEAWADLANQREKLSLEKQYVENDKSSTGRIKQELLKEKEQLQKALLSQDKIKQYQEEIAQANRAEQQEQYRKWQQTFQQQLKVSNLVILIGFLLAVGLFLVTDLLWVVVTLILAVGQNVAIRLYGKAVKQWLQPDLKEVVVLSQAEIKERERIIEQQTELQQSLSEMDKDVQKYQNEQLKQAERFSFLTERIEQIEQKISDQKQQYPFLTNVELTYWPRLYQQVITQKEKLLEIQRLETEISDLHEQLKEKQRAIDILEIDTDDLESNMEKEQTKRTKHQQLQTRRAEWQSQLDTVLEKQKPYQEEINLLLHKAEVDTEEAFIEKGERKEELDRLQQKHTQLYDSLAVLFSEEEIKRIAEGDFDEEKTLQVLLEECKQVINETTEQIKEKQALLSDKKATIAMLEANEDTSILKHQLAIKQEELQEIAKQWAVYHVALSNLTEAKSTYSQKYMPQVFEQASEYFSKLTLGRYQHIYIEDNETVIVEDRGGFVFEVIELSQATKDQLYIALRFALSHVMANRLALPFLIDDGFVHFDANRKEKVLEMIEELSNDHQVLYFTANATTKASITL